MYVTNQSGGIMANAISNAARMTANTGAIRGQGNADLGRSIGGSIAMMGQVAGRNRDERKLAESIRRMAEQSPEVAALIAPGGDLDALSPKDILAGVQALQVKSQVGELAIREMQQAEARGKQQETARINHTIDEALRMANPATGGHGVLRPEVREMALRLAESPLGAYRAKGGTVTGELVQQYLMQGQGAGGPTGFPSLAAAEQYLGERPGQVSQGADGGFRVSNVQVNRPEGGADADRRSQFIRDTEWMVETGQIPPEEGQRRINQHNERTAQGPTSWYDAHQAATGTKPPSRPANPRVVAQSLEDQLTLELQDVEGARQWTGGRGRALNKARETWRALNVARAEAGLAAVPLPAELGGGGAAAAPEAEVDPNQRELDFSNLNLR